MNLVEAAEEIKQTVASDKYDSEFHDFRFICK
jgi:hypothetical protein